MSDLAIVQKDQGLTHDQVELIKRTVARGATNDELQLFLHIATKTGLDPFARQIHFVKRWDSSLGTEVGTPQTGIDGYRLIAERTNRYAPGKEPTYHYDDKGHLISATAYVKKLTADGTWHEVAATAIFSEYAARKKDGGLTRFWAEKPHVMLAKVAEALALRKAFPMELSGIYTQEEMDQADNGQKPSQEAPQQAIKPKTTLDALVEAAKPVERVTQITVAEAKEIAKQVQDVHSPVCEPAEALDRIEPEVNLYPDEITALGYTDGVRPDCKGCRGEMRFNKAGISKPSEKSKGGKKYPSFWSCKGRCGARGWKCGEWVEEYKKRVQTFDVQGEPELPL